MANCVVGLPVLLPMHVHADSITQHRGLPRSAERPRQPSLRHLEFPVIVPHRPGHHSLDEKEAVIRRSHRLVQDVPVFFIEAALGDTSEFYHTPLMSLVQYEGRVVMRVTRCVSVAHVIATIALELSKVGKPPEIHFGWSDESPLAVNFRFLLFGEGNVPWMVRELIRDAEPDPERRPSVIVG